MLMNNLTEKFFTECAWLQLKKSTLLVALALNIRLRWKYPSLIMLTFLCQYINYRSKSFHQMP
jgi:hypothetical protein